MVVPTHTDEAPLIVPAFTEAVTVICFVAVALLQPTVYVIVTVPADTPVTTPVLLFTVARAVLLLVHTPPDVPFVVNCIVDPVHTDEEPLIVPAFEAAVTEIDFVVLAVPQPVTV